jgi:hypothetical protein
MPQSLLISNQQAPDNCDYYTLDGELITSSGFIVGDWLNPNTVGLRYRNVSSVEAAHVVTSVINDFCHWCESDVMKGVNAVGVCHVSTTECLVAPCYWCGGNESLAKYLAAETPGGDYARVN